MRLLEATLPRDHDLYLLSDDHEGTLAQHTAALDKVITEIAGNPLAYAAHLGDMCETLTVDHPYYDPRTLAKGSNGNPSIPADQVKAQARRYRPIADKLIAVLYGNHEHRVRNTMDMLADFLERIGREEIYGGYACKVTVRDIGSNLMYKAYLHHGRSLAESRAGSERQKEANRAEQLKRALFHLAGDCAIMAMGHTHRLIAVKPIKRLYLTDDGESLKQHYITSIQNAEYIDPESRFYVNTGTFLRNQLLNNDTYSEMRAYPPNKIGYAKVIVRDGVIRDVIEVPI